MSNTINTANQGVLCSIKDTTLNGVNWCGKMISSGWEGVKNLISKIIEYVGPFFSSLLRYVADVATKVKDFTVENKNGVGAALSLILAVIVGGLAIQAAFGGGSTQEGTPNSAN